MDIKLFFRNIWCLFMGSSTALYRPKRSFQFPIVKHQLNENLLFIQGGIQNTLIYKGSILNLDSPMDLGDIQIIKIQLGEYSKNIIVIEKKYVCLGDLFYNKVHPILTPDLKKLSATWINQHEKIKTQYTFFIPGDGSIGNANDLENFILYLKDLTKLDFAEFREKYSIWSEIIGSSSLSENFDF